MNIRFETAGRHRGIAASAAGAGLALLCLLTVGLAAGVAHAEDRLQVGEADDFIPLYQGKPYLHVIHDGRSVKVQRVQDPAYELQGYFARTARKCPPFCIQPITPDPSVLSIGEVELFDFMETSLRDGTGVLIDARTESWFRKGTIPGSVNYPFTLFDKPTGDPELDRLLEGFGAEDPSDVTWAAEHG